MIAITQPLQNLVIDAPRGKQQDVRCTVPATVTFGRVVATFHWNSSIIGPTTDVLPAGWVELAANGGAHEGIVVIPNDQNIPVGAVMPLPSFSLHVKAQAKMANGQWADVDSGTSVLFGHDSP